MIQKKKTTPSTSAECRISKKEKSEAMTCSNQYPSTSVTTVFIIDDHELMSATLKEILGRDGEFQVIGISSNGAAALEELAKTPADIVLLDLVLPGMNGVEVAREILVRFPNTKIAVCSGVESDEAIEMAFASGAHTFVEKRVKVDELLKALRMLRDGLCHLPERQARILKESVRRRSAKKKLAAHDMRILRRMVHHQSAKEIAAEEGVSQSCVYKARRRIEERVGGVGPGGIHAAATRLGLVQQEVNQRLPVETPAGVGPALQQPLGAEGGGKAQPAGGAP